MREGPFFGVSSLFVIRIAIDLRVLPSPLYSAVVEALFVYLEKVLSVGDSTRMSHAFSFQGKSWEAHRT